MSRTSTCTAPVDPSSTRLFAWRSGLLDGTEFGLGDAVDAVQRGLFDTDVFADHFGRDTRVAQPQCQRVRQRKRAKCALMGVEFIGHAIRVRPSQDDDVSRPLLDFPAYLSRPHSGLQWSAVYWLKSRISAASSSRLLMPSRCEAR
jgi:hypothetical protein